MRNVIRELQRDLRRGELVLVVGAGVSSAPPSTLPLAGGLVREVRRQLLGEVDRSLGKIDVRPEVLFRSVARHKRKELIELLIFMLGSRRFNRGHELCACAMNLGNGVVTTNFDILIETACETLGLANASNLLKLHGSIDQPRSLMFSIDHITKPLTARARRALRHLTRDKTVLVLGYSGLDQFDVMPALAACSYRRVIWVMHDKRARSPVVTPPNNRWISQLNDLDHVKCDTNRLLTNLLAPTLHYDLDPKAARIVVELLMQQGKYKAVRRFIESEGLSGQLIFDEYELAVDAMTARDARNVSTTLRHPRAAFSEPRLASGDS